MTPSRCLWLSCLTSVATLAGAQSADGNVHIEVLLAQPSYAGCADPAFAFDDLACLDIGSSPSSSGVNAVWFLVTTEPGGWENGVGGVQFGIEHEVSVVPETWVFCTGGSEAPQDDALGRWPQSGTGYATLWSGSCHVPDNDVARIGFFHIDSPEGCVAIIEDPRSDAARYVDCSANEIDIPPHCLSGHSDVQNATVLFCECGNNADCRPVPNGPSTWSSLKRTFAD